MTKRSIAAFVRSTLMSVNLLMGRGAWKYAVVDSLIIIYCLVAALFSIETSVEAVFKTAVLLPILVIGVPLMSNSVDLERSAGTLDIALTSRGARHYFERRVGGVIAILFVQSSLIVLLLRTLIGFHLAPAIGQALTVNLFMAATALLWCVLLRSAGAVMLATWLTSLVFVRWLSSNPVFRFDDVTGPMDRTEFLTWTGNNVILLLASVIFYMYAIRKLSRPEEILS